MSKPCDKCPWLHEPGVLTPEVRAAAERGDWFCCHVRMGTCAGAAAVSKKQERMRNE